MLELEDTMRTQRQADPRRKRRQGQGHRVKEKFEETTADIARLKEEITEAEESLARMRDNAT